MDFNRWWQNDLDEIYWMEVTDRKDLGRDLNAPQTNDDGREYYGYSLIKEIKEGDIVFHYHTARMGIVAISKATNSFYEDKVLWAAHGTTARGKNVQPYLRDGWRRGLVDFKLIEPSMDLSQIRLLESGIREIRRDLESRYGKSLYFPFELSNTRPLRPNQPYLTKLPKDIVNLASPLRAALLELYQTQKNSLPVRFSTVLELGASYRVADEEASVSEYEPFTVDPVLAERARRGHATTQNALANYLRIKGIEPRSPRPGEPNFDLAWAQENFVFVAEIKSLTSSNEEMQLRLGLGQVLRYSHFLANMYSDMQVRIVLVTEREPSDQSWLDLCRGLGILLVWPGVFDKYL